MAPVLRLDNVHLAYGSRPLLEQASLQVEPGERVCIVGRNGEGKSSLMRLVNGDALPDAGTVWLRPGARRAHLPQDIATVTGETVREVVAGGLPEVARLLASFGYGSGHVFNLGHGISQYTPPEHVAALIDAVHSLSRQYHVPAAAA